MVKIDFKKTLKPLFAPPVGAFVEIDVPALRHVKVDGTGNPNNVPAYQVALTWLYGVSYGMKFACKAALGQDYVVPPLEGLWWADDPSSFTARDKDKWHWTMMIMVPDFVDAAMFEAAVEKTAKKAGPPPESLRFETTVEGLSLQTMHIGSYDDEAPTLANLHDVLMPAKGVTFNGPHHEIYISDPRRTEAAKLKTVLRQPVRL